MPLIHSSSNEARQENIREMISSGHTTAQAVAASYNNQREAQRASHHEREAPRHEHEMRKYGQ
jgi:ribosomal protein L12E/L44/L45/RPP1/RPP2